MNRILSFLLFVSIPSMAARANWNQFRGSVGDGNAGAANIPIEFSDTKNVRWRTAIHDRGHSSPVIWGNQIWLTSGTADSRRLYAICVDLESGTIVHDIEVFHIPLPNLPYPNLNSPASPTPVVEEGRVYVHFGSFGTACLDTETGEKLWERTDLHCDHRVRAASSPIVDSGLIYLTFDGVDVQYFVALDKRTGETVWRRDRSVNRDFSQVLRESGVRDPKKTMKEKPGDNRKSYATPTIIEHAGRRQVVSPAAEATYGYDAKTGEELWYVLHPGMGWNVTCRPIYRDGLVYFTTGISKHLFAVDPGGRGNVTDTHVQWKERRGVSHLPSFIIENDLVFMVSDQSGLANCLDARTGKQVWQERLRAGREHWASPVAAGGKIYFFSKSGDVAVIAADRRFEILAKNRIDGTLNASPAVVGDSLILRSGTHLYHIAEGYETAPQEKKPEDSSDHRVVQNQPRESKGLITTNGYFLGGETNEGGKFQATFLMETDGDKANWPTVTLTGDQFRGLCEGLEKHHRVSLNLATGKVAKAVKSKDKRAGSKKGKNVKKDKPQGKDNECQNSNLEGYRSIVQGSATREYILHVPASYDGDRPIPLMINFHGFGDCASRYLKDVGDRKELNLTADHNNFLVAYPQAAFREKGARYWDPGDNGGENIRENDVYFTRQLIADIGDNYNLDRSRVYAVGFSNGGMMAYGLACAGSDFIAAVGIMSGIMLSDGCDSTNGHTSSIHFHGIADGVLPYKGNKNYKSVSDVVDSSLRHNEIVASSRITTELNEGDVVRDVYQGGKENTSVALYTVKNEHGKAGGHVWCSDDIDGTHPNQILWDFLSSYSLND